jgi:hypothetical protein
MSYAARRPRPPVNTFNKKMNRRLVFDLATGAFIARHEDAERASPTRE